MTRIARTPELLANVCALRAQGLTWPAIAERLDIGMSSAHRIGVELGLSAAHSVRIRARLPVSLAPTSSEACEAEEAGNGRRLDGSALPAGHPLTWGAISAAPYPHQGAA